MSTSARFSWAIRRVVMVFALGFVVTGCATGRDVIDVRLTSVTTPGSGPVVRIERVSDRRVFQANPREATIPSLGNKNEISDPAITGRAIARKRGGMGKAFGDILLPEGRTVAGLVEEALNHALQEAGYRVVGKQDPQAATAIPVEADIDQFWAWFRPGFAQVAVEFEARVQIKAPVAALQGLEPVKGFARVTGMAATDSTWREAVNKGLEDFVRNARDHLKATNR